MRRSAPLGLHHAGSVVSGTVLLRLGAKRADVIRWVGEEYFADSRRLSPSDYHDALTLARMGF